MISLQIGELEEKVRNMLMLKFGRLVDLEKLETVTVNRTVEELKEKLRQQESKSAAEITKWNVSNTLKRIELTLVFASIWGFISAKLFKFIMSPSCSIFTILHVFLFVCFIITIWRFLRHRGMAPFKTMECSLKVLTHEGTCCRDMVQDM